MSGGVSPIPVPCHRIDTNSPPGDSADKGIAERAILIVGGLARTKKAVEENVLEGRDAGPRLTAWMVHHAAQVIDLAWSEQTRGASSARRWQVSVNTCGSETRFWKERTSSIRDAQRRGCLDSASSRRATSWWTLMGGCAWSGRSRDPTLTTDGKSCHQEILSRPPI